MRDSQKVYIKGSRNRSAEVIKALTDLGGINSNNLKGISEKCYYFISPSGIIMDAAYDDKRIMPLLTEFYKEIQLSRWKPKNEECYYFIDDRGTIITSMWNKYGERKDNLRYEFGNCFRTKEEAEEVINKIKEVLNNR